MNRLPSVQEIAARMTSAHPSAGELSLNLAGWGIRVASNRESLIAELAEYFRPFVATPQSPPQLTVLAMETAPPELGMEYTIKQPDEGKTKIKEEWADIPGGRVVRKRLTGMVFVFGDGHHLALGPCLANTNQVVNFINNRLIQLELGRGALLAHAAGIKSGQVGLALAGFSGMGKSTLALHLMSLGATFISNDRLMVRRVNDAAEMTGVAKLPRINPGTALNNPDLAGVIGPDETERFQQMGLEEIWDLEHKYDVDIDQCFGPGRFELHSPLNALAILNWQRDSGELKFREVDLEQRRDLLAAFKKDWGLFFLSNGRPPDHSDRAYLRELAGVRVFELAGGVDFHGAGRRLLRELGDLA